MRISVDVCGYYDWVPVPPGTEITEEDVSSLRVKKMTDEKWHMRVTMQKETHHDVGLHEDAICQRMAALEKMGRGESREQVIAEMLKLSFRHHLAPSHLIKINVDEDGPNEAAFRAALTEAGVLEQEEAMAHYLDGTNLETYLNMVFKTKSTKKRK